MLQYSFRVQLYRWRGMAQTNATDALQINQLYVSRIGYSEPAFSMVLSVFSFLYLREVWFRIVHNLIDQG
jgi:DNA-binding phage protein